MPKRMKKPGTKRKQPTPKAGPIGCVVLILAALAFTIWAMTGLSLD